jgi:two-component system response regulator YesN
MVKVLIVDDDNLVRKGLISILPWEEYGMEVVGEAKNGEKALEFLASNPVDLLLTDLAMPVMSGMELMRIVRKQYPHIFIVVLTLHQDFEYIQECLRLGAIDYIAKFEMENENFAEVIGRVKGRIAEEQSKTASPSFYEPRHAHNWNEADRGLAPSSSSTAGDMLSEIQKNGITLGWVHRESEFAKFLDDLKELRLPPAKLISLLHSQWVAWDRIYYSVTEKQIELPVAFHSWTEVEEWLSRVRELLVTAIGKSPYSEEVKECIVKAVQAMHEELSCAVHASEMAKRVNMSRSYFSQCFKDLVGMTFNEYLRHIRMEKAKEYLQYTQKTIQWIAENTGYTDQKYFSRVFLEKTGVLPSEYRQTIQLELQMSDS